MERFLAVCFFIAASSGVQLPPTFTKCSRADPNFGDCLTKSVENAIRQLDKPFTEVGLINMEPLEVPSLVIGAGSGPVAFQQNYKNMKVTGFKKIRCSKVDFDFSKNILKTDCKIPEFRLDFDYDIKGKILLLPIYGNGPGTMILHNNNLVLTMHLEEHEKKGVKHFRVVKNELLIDPEWIEFDLKNLFNGDKLLGDNILKVMNENWKELFLDVEASYEEAFGKIFSSIFDRLLGKVSISDLFG